MVVVVVWCGGGGGGGGGDGVTPRLPDNVAVLHAHDERRACGVCVIVGDGVGGAAYAYAKVEQRVSFCPCRHQYSSCYNPFLSKTTQTS